MIHFALLLWVTFSECLALCPARGWGIVFIRSRMGRFLHIRELRGDTALSLVFILSIGHWRRGSRGSLDSDVVLDAPAYRSNSHCQLPTVGASRVETLFTETGSEWLNACSTRRSSSESSRACEQSKLVAKRMVVQR